MFKSFQDQTNRGIVIQADSPLEVVRFAAEEAPKNGAYFADTNNNWLGRSDLHQWADLVPAYNRPWEYGLRRVETMLQEIRNTELPEPKSVRRRNRWSETDGEVDVDRAVRGDADYLRHARREDTAGPRNIALLLHVGGAAIVRADDMFWRGAGAIAALDMLEDAGYSCEVWIWNRATGTYYGSNCTDSYFCCKVKEAGEPVNTNDLVNVTSTWFYRAVVLRAEMGVGRFKRTMGMTHPQPAGFVQHMDVTEGIKRVQFPFVQNQGQAIQAAKWCLEQATNHEVEAE